MNLRRPVQPSQRTEEGYLKPVSGKTFLILLKVEKPAQHILFPYSSSKLIEKISPVKMMIENAIPNFTESY